MALRFLLSGIGTLLLFMAFLGLGNAALILLGFKRRKGAFWLLVRTGLGFGIIGNGIMVLCFLHLAQPRIITWFICLAFCAALPFLIQHLRETLGYANLVKQGIRRHPALACACLFMLIGYMAIGLFPPADFDALMYHLSTAKLYLQHGGFWNIYFNAQSDYPMLTEMVYMIGMALGNDSICKTTSFGISFLLVCAIVCAARRYLKSTGRDALLSILVFCTGTSVIAGFTACNVDMAQALWTLLAVLCLELYIEERRSAALLLCALFAGMALQTKIFGIFILPVLLVRLVVAGSPRHDKPDRGRRLGFRKVEAILRGAAPYLIIVFAALLMGLPWYLKAFYFKGTILSVYHASIEGQGLAAPMNVQAGSTSILWIVNSVVRVCAAPWTFSLFPGQHQGDTFGPLFIAIPPFLLVTGVPCSARFLLIAAGIYGAMILTLEMAFIQGGSSIRYSTFIIAIGSIFVPWTVSRLASRPAIKRMTSLMMLSMIALGMVIFVKRNHREWTALFAMKSRDVYYASVLKEYPVIARINALTDGKAVMPIYNYTDYLIDVPYVTAYRTYRNPEEMRADLHAKNIGYLFANDKFDTADNSRAWPEFPEKTCIAAKNGFYLYRLDSIDTRK